MTFKKLKITIKSLQFNLLFCYSLLLQRSKQVHKPFASFYFKTVVTRI